MSPLFTCLIQQAKLCKTMNSDNSYSMEIRFATTQLMTIQSLPILHEPRKDMFKTIVSYT